MNTTSSSKGRHRCPECGNVTWVHAFGPDRDSVRWARVCPTCESAWPIDVIYIP